MLCLLFITSKVIFYIFSVNILLAHHKSKKVVPPRYIEGMKYRKRFIKKKKISEFAYGIGRDPSKKEKVRYPSHHGHMLVSVIGVCQQQTTRNNIKELKYFKVRL